MIYVVNPTAWECEYADGEHNSYFDIHATDEGIDLEWFGTIPWAEIDAARAALADAPKGEA